MVFNRALACFVLLLTLIPALSAAVEFQVLGALRQPNAGQLYVVTVQVSGFNSSVSQDIGVRIDTPNVLDTFSAACYDSQFVSSSPSEVVYRRPTNAARGPVVIKLGLKSKPDFRGTYRLTPFVRPTGSTSDSHSTIRFISVGTLPAPNVTSPRSGRILSPAPTTRFQLSLPYVVPVSYEILYQTSVGPRAFVVTTQNSGPVVSQYVTADIGLREGPATCRVRALDGAGYPGEWSPEIPFTVSGGMDLAGACSQATFANFRAKGWTSHFQASWGGRNVWPDARQNLINAHNAGMKVATYAFLNFDNSSTISGAPSDQTGIWQMDKCLQNIGFNGNKSSLAYDLKYVVVDVENTYVGTMSPANRVQRIAEAVQRARNYGFWPAIYTRNQGVNTWWNTYTGNSTDFSDLPLWGSYPEVTSANFKDHLDLDGGSPYIPFGGWTTRAGKQYQLDSTIMGVRVDLNVWDPAIWDVMSPEPGTPSMIAEAAVRRKPGGGFWLDISVTNNGTCEAYAVRIKSITLNGAPHSATESLNKIDANQQKTFTRSYGAGVGQLGQTVPCTFTVWTGMGPQDFTFFLTL